MAKLETLSYIVSVDAIQNRLLSRITSMDPNGLLLLAEEVKSGALLQACAWLSSGGVAQWRKYSEDSCIQFLYLNIMELARGFTDGPASLTHLPGRCWAISVEDWAMVNAVFAYGLADNILRHTHGIHETIDRYGDSAVFFAPQRIVANEGRDAFIFQLGFYNRELLSTSA